MFPASFQTSAALVLVLGGLLACFLGFRLFRVVLGIYGFILGALLATSVAGSLEPFRTVLVAVGGGLAGALVLIFAYFVGVALVGAGIGALIVHLAWSRLDGDPHAFAVIAASMVGALAALALQRYVIVTGTSFGGAWTTIVGGLSLAGREASVETTRVGDVWLPYPLHPAPGEEWVVAAWIVLGSIGLVVQLATTGRTGRRKGRTG